MKRLKIQKGVLVGGFLPRPTHDKLNLLVMYRETTKAKVIQDYLNNLIKDAPSEKEMVEDIAQKLLEDWRKLYKKGDKKISWKNYLEEVRVGLARKISPSHIDMIVEGMAEKKGKGERTLGKEKD